MKILSIEHIGIAVEDIQDRSPFWEHILGIKHSSTEIVEHEGVKTDIYDTKKEKETIKRKL